jgi:putative DNA primase/helicase
MIAAVIARALGGACRSGEWWRCRCPVHKSRGSTLALKDGARGLVVKCFAGCDACDVLAELRRLGSLDDRPCDSATSCPTVGRENDARRMDRVHRIWNATRDARGSPVVRYLAGRGITIPLPPPLRWAPRCCHPSGIYLPAMIAAIVDVDGRLIGVHRTYLRSDGSGKAEVEPAKAMLGRAAGGAVRLGEPGETLLIAEGLETGLSVMQATSQPVWAAVSTSGLGGLALPPGVYNIVILADHDANGSGERAAQTAAARWLVEGRRVRIAIPPEPGTDFNDVLSGRACARITKAGNVAS